MDASATFINPFVMPARTFAEAQEVVSFHAPDCYYDQAYRGMETYYLPNLFNWLEGQERGSVLEIGPGWGTTMVWLSSNGWTDITVMDIMPKGHWITQELLDLCGAEFIQGDICAGPLARTFDLIVMTQVIPHLKYQPVQALEHVCEMMNGALVACVLDDPEMPAAFGHDWRAVPLHGDVPPVEDMVVCMYTTETFEEIMDAVFDEVRLWHPPGPVIFGEAHTDVASAH